MSRGKRSEPSHERTEEERERDRAERVRRRAERMGEPSAGEPAHAEPSASDPELAGGALAQGDGEPVQPGAQPEHADAALEPADVPPGAVDVPPELVDVPLEPADVPPEAVVSSRAASRPQGSAAGPRRSRRRSPIARTLALVALVAVVAAVVLLAKSLAGSGKSKTVPVVPVAKVVIPEGETRLQIAQIATHDGLTGSYRAASKRSPLLSPTHYGAPSSTRDLEGFLFPATYDVYLRAPVSKLVQEQLVAFRENFGSKEIARARALHVTPYGLLTVASMVEREAKVPADRAKIAAVIYNRLKREMPLGVDATIYYAIELEKGIPTYTSELTEAQLHLNSPYNTRIHTGLPPTPISNPGMASIEAAANPAHVAYVYYVLAADGCGEHVFSSTLAQFEVDAAAYQAAVKKNGGSPPSCKKK